MTQATDSDAPPSLFNEFEAMTEEAHELASRVERAILPIIREYAILGYRVREIESVLELTLGVCINELVVRRALAQAGPFDPPDEDGLQRLRPDEE